MRNAHCRTKIVASKLKNVENETQTLYDLEYGEKTDQQRKIGNSHGRTWNMARNTEKQAK
jgi:hypothetical protein